MTDFVNLHAHSSFSPLDGAMSPQTMAEQAKRLGQSALAITDHGNIHGIIKFWDACKGVGIIPLIGTEAYMAPGSRHFKEPLENIPPAFHLTLLAKNETGLRNLYHLSSKAFTEGLYYKPRIDHELLQQYSDGVVCLSGCFKGKIQWLLHAYAISQLPNRQEFLDMAYKEAADMQAIFGQNFFIEFQRIIPEQEPIVQLQIELCKKLNLKGVATCDAHYATAADVDFHEQIICLATGKTIKDTNRMGRMPGLYLKSIDEMLKLWHDLPEVVHNTNIVKELCVPLSKTEPFKMNGYIFPTFDSHEKDIEIFVQQAKEGLEKKGKGQDREYIQRLDYELETIKDMGFPSYFLIVADYCRYAKEKGIGVGAGRGSAAGSLVAYCLGITDVDPIEYDLLFQRFLNKGRKSMPDIDCDFCMNRRAEVVEYITQRYGEDKIAQISTFAEFKPKGACRDFARVQGEPMSLGEEVSKLIPPPMRGRNPTWAEALEASPSLLDSKFNQIVKMAQRSEGMVRQRGVHASGLVISDRPMDEIAPRCSKGGEVFSQWDMDDLERIGLVKMDILGLTALTIISKALEIIYKTTGEKLVMSEIPRNDEDTYRLIGRGQTSGLFQLDGGGGIRDLCTKLKPQSISEIATISAIYRPGPIDSGVAEEYVRRVNDPNAIVYLVPELEPILKNTCGLLVYQEQAMRIATDLAGYTLEEADDLRKAIGKKLPEKMAKEEKRIIEGMTSRGIAEEDARTIWQQIQVFADYGFNASHAVAYSFTTYYTAYLKTHYPLQFFCALLSLHMGQREKIIEYLGECRKVDIQVAPPDINGSDVDFMVDNGIIRFGLAAVKDIGEKVSARIIETRNTTGRFTDIFDFCKRTKPLGVNRRTIEALAKAGAFDSLNIKRSAVLNMLNDLIDQDKEAEKYEKKLITYNKRLSAYNERELERKQALEGGGKPKSSLRKPDKPIQPSTLKTPEIDELNEAALIDMEYEMLGVYVSSHPLYKFEREILHNTTAHTGSLEDHRPGEEVTIIGIISQMKRFTTRKGDEMATIILEDLHGNVEVIVFPSTFSKYGKLLGEGNVMLITGKLEGGEDAANRIIAFTIDCLEQKQIVKHEEHPKQITIKIDNVSNKLVDDIKSIIAICPGDVKVKVILQFCGFSFTLRNATPISWDGIKKILSYEGVCSVV